MSALRNKLRKKGERPDFSPMVEGNQLARKENMSPESHGRRLQALARAWATSKRKRMGEKIVPVVETIKRKSAKRVKLYEAIVREAREIQDAARTRTLAAVERLSKIVESDTSKDSDAIAASIALLDRAYGKASQTNINANVDANGKNADISAKELNIRIEAALKRIGELTTRASEAPKGEERSANLRKRDRDSGDSTVH